MDTSSPATSIATSRFLVDVEKLDRQWIAKIPGWSDPVASPQLAGASATEEVARPETRALGKFGELWLASQLTRAGLNNVVIAQDRLRVDCVDLVLHHLPTCAMGGLVVHTSSINGRGYIQFQIRHQTFFMDPRLYVVVLVYHDDGALHDTAFLIPAMDIPKVATPSIDRGAANYHGYHRLQPLASKLRPYAVPTEKLAVTIFERLFISGSKTTTP